MDSATSKSRIALSVATDSAMHCWLRRMKPSLQTQRRPVSSSAALGGTVMATQRPPMGRNPRTFESAEVDVLVMPAQELRGRPVPRDGRQSQRLSIERVVRSAVTVVGLQAAADLETVIGRNDADGLYQRGGPEEAQRMFEVGCRRGEPARVEATPPESSAFA